VNVVNESLIAMNGPQQARPANEIQVELRGHASRTDQEIAAKRQQYPCAPPPGARTNTSNLATLRRCLECWQEVADAEEAAARDALDRG
jgi:hypothetical protein